MVPIKVRKEDKAGALGGASSVIDTSVPSFKQQFSNSKDGIFFYNSFTLCCYDCLTVNFAWCVAQMSQYCMNHGIKTY